MESLKRVSWKVGQPLLPRHLVAQEESLVAHTNFSFKHLGLPFYGVGLLKWDDTLLTQGIISIIEITVVFSSGQLISVPGNGIIHSVDLNKTGKNRVILYLHLLSEQNEEEDYDGYLPPLLSIQGNPFFHKILIELKTKLEQFQNAIEMISVEGEEFEGHTLETNLCLLEVAKMRRLLLNIDHHVATHPYHLYEKFSQYLDTVALLYNNKTNFKLIPYQHEKLGPLFSTMMDALSLDEVTNHQISQLEFEKKDRCYVSEKLPQELQDAKEVYLILQKIDTVGNPNVEGVKLSAYSRLMNTVIFGVQGIPIIRIDRAPFNHNFSKRANIYTVEKGVEWAHAVKEGRLAFDYKDNNKDVQAFLYWR